MRVLVIVLTLLAAAKIGAHQYLIGSAKNEIIISAYRDRAVGACREAARAKRMDVPSSWTRDGAISLVIGKSNLDVALWQVDHALWHKRYKSPYLLLSLSEAPLRVLCEFDITQGAAALVAL